MNTDFFIICLLKFAILETICLKSIISVLYEIGSAIRTVNKCIVRHASYNDVVTSKIDLYLLDVSR